MDPNGRTVSGTLQGEGLGAEPFTMSKASESGRRPCTAGPKFEC
jgi:hypothetical protein